MKVEVLKYEFNIATVKYTPNSLQKAMGMKEETIQFTHRDENYTYGNELKWYYLDTGKVRGRFERLDEYIRTQEFKS